MRLYSDWMYLLGVFSLLYLDPLYLQSGPLKVLIGRAFTMVLQSIEIFSCIERSFRDGLKIYYAIETQQTAKSKKLP